MSAKVEYINTQPWSNLFEVSPPQFNVKCQLQKEEFLQLSIISNCNDCIAWKLKTNRPGRYMVSPKQGIIRPKQHKDCTVVLSKLKEIPDTKKPDKFLIQATKIHSHTQLSDLPQLWKDRESKHDKKRGVYAYQSVTIKCFLNIDIKPPKSEEKKQNETIKQNDTPKQNETPVIIEKYYTSDSIAPVQEIDSITITAPGTNVSTINTNKSKNNNVIQPIIRNTPNIQEQKSDKSDSITEIKTEPQQSATINEPTYDPTKVDEWRKKSLEYDELFQFTQKLLAQRDELKVRWKSEQEKTRNYMKLNRELKEEKKEILNEYNKYRNRNEMNDEEDMDGKYDDDDEKREILLNDNDINDTIKSENERREMIEEFNEIERNAVRNSKKGFTISCVHVMITLMLMYVAFMIGKYNVFGGEEMENQSDNNVANDTVDVTGDKHEM